MGVGIGPVEMVIILAVLGVIFWIFFRGAFGRRPGSVGGSGNLPHPQLRQCPGCGAQINIATEVCSHCGLRISS